MYLFIGSVYFLAFEAWECCSFILLSDNVLFNLFLLLNAGWRDYGLHYAAIYYTKQNTPIPRKKFIMFV